jgi:hypothetical protein
MDREVAWRAQGSKAADQLGWCLAGMDREGAGVTREIAIGAVQSEGWWTTAKGPGRVELRRLDDGQVLLEVQGQRSGDWFGASLCPVEDVDDDGYRDLAVGAPVSGIAVPGYVSLVSTKSGAILWTAKGHEEDRNFGAELTRIGDVDGDGQDDLLVGVSGPSESRWSAGRIAALSSATGVELYTVELVDSSLGVGSALDSIADIDGDGCLDAVALGIHAPAFNYPHELDVLLISGANGKARSIATVHRGWGELAVGQGSDGCPRIAVGLPQGDMPDFSRHGGAIEFFLPSGERDGLLAASKEECGDPEHFSCAAGDFGSTLTFLEGASDAKHPPLWLVGAPSYWDVGFAAFMDGQEWSSRQVVRQKDLPAVRSPR